MQPITYFFLYKRLFDKVTACKLEESTIATDCKNLMQKLQNLVHLQLIAVNGNHVIGELKLTMDRCFFTHLK